MKLLISGVLAFSFIFSASSISFAKETTAKKDEKKPAATKEVSTTKGNETTEFKEFDPKRQNRGSKETEPVAGDSSRRPFDPSNNIRVKRP
jgi:hypothetical protein